MGPLERQNADAVNALGERAVAVQPAGATSCTYCLPYENGAPITIVRGMKYPINEAWSSAKHYG